MISFLKIFFRNLRRGGIYSIVNVVGLTMGMAAAMLIFIWIHHEWSYDRFHAKEKQLYKVWNRGSFDGSLRCWDLTPKIMGPTLKDNYPEIAATARMNVYELLYGAEDKKVNVSTGFTDSDFLTMFDFSLLSGNPETALNDPYSVILTEKAAVRLFGNENPAGKTITIDNTYSLTVTGVMKDLPGNTAFQFEALAPVAFMKTMGRYYDENWSRNSAFTYVELRPGADLEKVNQAVQNITKEHTDHREQTEVFLYPLSHQHLYSRFENGIPTGGLIDTLRIFALIAISILLIACINFMNLSTARSEKRAKETGVRKVLGSKRSSLIGQFLGESTLTAFIAGAAALPIVTLMLPVFNTLMGKSMILAWDNVWFWAVFLAFILFTGLLAGGYPAFYLSSFLPVKVLKGIFKKEHTLVAPRKILVIVQFAVACFLMVDTLTIHRQVQYAQNREAGYDKDQLIYCLLKGDMRKNYELIKQELLHSSAAVSVTKTFSPMTEGWGDTWGIEWRGKNPDDKTLVDIYFADADWTKTVGTTIVEGRDIDAYTYPTDSAAMLLNETAVKLMNFDHPVGEIIKTQGREWHVVGVIKDFVFRSPYQSMAPLFVGGPKGFLGSMHLRLNGANKTSDNLARAEAVFKKYNPDYPFEYTFVDEAYARKFAEERRIGAFVSWFAGLTIFISCLGLFALAAYMAEARKKEIGIRKVLGASVKDVISLLSKEFLILVIVSVVVASPAAWWVMNQWLSSYAYRTDIPWWLFVVVGAMSLFIALLTVGWQALRAATADSVKSLSP